MKNLFLKHISLSHELNIKGGRRAAVENEDLQPLYDKILNLEDEILKRFGLPKLMKFRAVIWDVKSENDIADIELELKNLAAEYLLSSLKKDIDLLKDAKLNDLKTYEVLPEIGFEDNLCALFYFEEYFKKDKITEENLITILKNIDEETSTKMGQLHFNITREVDSSQAEKLFSELNEKQVPYLKEFTNFRPVFPY